jgi:excisionase family DNA binding protein
MTGRRHGIARDGRRATDAWTVTELAREIGMSPEFVRAEIVAGELQASRFGREYRLQSEIVVRYLVAKGWWKS